MLALVLQRPRLPFGEIVRLRIGLAARGVDPAGDNVQMLMLGVIVGNENRLRVLHTE